VAFDELSSRRPKLQVAFIHHDTSKVARCVNELKRVGYAVDYLVLPDAELLPVHPDLTALDVAICEYPSNTEEQNKLAAVLSKAPKEVPLILVAEHISKEAAATLLLNGIFDTFTYDTLTHLPVAIRRAQSEKALRHDRDRAEKELRRLQAQYHALAGNLNYGICRCAPDGSFCDVNQALVAMLCYSTKEELLAVNIASAIFADPTKRAQLLGQSPDGAVDPVEADWVRKDGVHIKVKLSAQEVFNEAGQLTAFEVIVEDVTKQRELEDHLRRLAASDPLTGLANYRHLVDALDKEIRRSNRTGREFSLLMFDMDGLKQINDSFGHVTGSQALCRMADALSLFCRDIDTAARFGGDEFALLLPETGRDAANIVARRISSSIAEDSNGPALSVSVGVSVFPRDADNVESLVSAADSDMYANKRQRQHRRATTPSSD
jgi:diguanylate cyclase (GGDEF)-like protein/PAS domain S-box-containing protein